MTSTVAMIRTIDFFAAEDTIPLLRNCNPFISLRLMGQYHGPLRPQFIQLDPYFQVLWHAGRSFIAGRLGPTTSLGSGGWGWDIELPCYRSAWWRHVKHSRARHWNQPILRTLGRPNKYRRFGKGEIYSVVQLQMTNGQYSGWGLGKKATKYDAIYTKGRPASGHTTFPCAIEVAIGIMYALSYRSRFFDDLISSQSPEPAKLP